MNKVLGLVIFLLVIVVAVLAWMLFVSTAHAPTTSENLPVVQNPTTTQSSTTEPSLPLHSRVVVDSPAAHSTVGKNFDISGQAPGNWYFEASFPIQVRDQNGNVIGQSHGSAQGEWMTEAQVPFKATINIDTNYSGAATLILMKDNPSGLPENDDALEVPIVIGQ